MAATHGIARQTTSFHLLVGGTPGAQWKRLLPRLQAGSHCKPSEDALDRWRAIANSASPPEALNNATSELLEDVDGMALVAADFERTSSLFEYWLNFAGDTSLMLLHCRPEVALARAMIEGKSPSVELSCWKEEAKEFLALYRRNRGRVCLIDAEQAMARPIEFQEASQNKMGLRVGNADSQECGAHEEPEEVHRLIATQMVAQSEEARDLADELEACSIPLGAPVPPAAIDCESVFRGLVRVEEREELQEQCRNLTEKNEQLELRIKQAEDELGQVSLNAQKESEFRKSLEESLTSKGKEAEQLADEKNESEHLISSLKEENELLLLQLQQVHEELESYYLRLRDQAEKSQKLEEKLAARNVTIKNKNWAIDKKEEKYQRVLKEKKDLSKRLEAASDKLAQIRQSVSWRITQPLREVGKLKAKKASKTGGA